MKAKKVWINFDWTGWRINFDRTGWRIHKKEPVKYDDGWRTRDFSWGWLATDELEDKFAGRIGRPRPGVLIEYETCKKSEADLIVPIGMMCIDWQKYFAVSRTSKNVYLREVCTWTAINA